MHPWEKIQATAVLTWLLLQPPVSGGEVLVGAPLGDWMINGRFQTSQECESTRSMNLAALAYAESTGGTNARGVSNRSVITASRCMSEDELRAALATVTPPPRP
jgi:hypothetical protein